MDVKRFGYIAKMGPYISIKEFEKLCLLFTVYIYPLFEIVFSEQEDKCTQIKSAISNCTEK